MNGAACQASVNAIACVESTESVESVANPPPECFAPAAVSVLKADFPRLFSPRRDFRAPHDHRNGFSVIRYLGRL